MDNICSCVALISFYYLVPTHHRSTIQFFWILRAGRCWEHWGYGASLLMLYSISFSSFVLFFLVCFYSCSRSNPSCIQWFLFCCFIWLVGWLGLLLCFSLFRFILLHFPHFFSLKKILLQFPYFPFYVCVCGSSVVWFKHKHVSYFDSSSVVFIVHETISYPWKSKR